MNYLTIHNHQSVLFSEIPELKYKDFFELNSSLVDNNSERHCVNYFGFKTSGPIKLICCIADDLKNEIYVSSSHVKPAERVESLTANLNCFEKFEREIHENFGINFIDHPWLKPVRYAYNRFNPKDTIANYPFYEIHSEELHEVAVGPIHAGIIEPGHFRFICNGEQILHLEIQLGYQHRGIESLILSQKTLLQKSILAENIAGDTVVGHSVTFSKLWESLCNFTEDRDLAYTRTIALELERIAIHVGDLSAVCTDIAYQLGSSVFGRLRTPIVNFMQEWCGNRLSKGLIRAGKNQFPFTKVLADRLSAVLNAFEPDFVEMSETLFNLPSALSRFERTGVVNHQDALSIGTVGMAARMSGIQRDIRSSHPFCLYSELNHQSTLKSQGDVFSRMQIRREEMMQSIGYLRQLITNHSEPSAEMKTLGQPAPNSFAISLVEGWRGEICHCAITGMEGELLAYKIKDPSFHNWLALALAVRNNEISDFPICNKSFNLSYCGHDL